MNNPSELYLGLISGTSVDSVDIALVSFDKDGHSLIAFDSYPIILSLREQLLACNHSASLSLEQFCALQRQTGELFVQVVQQFLQEHGISPSAITAIGSHGQTIYHAPEIGMSLQIGHPAIIAKQTGITTVADFRIDDMALGGQGAPFAPAYHQTLFASPHRTNFAVNIGGIANLSVVTTENTFGFDTGPGNGIMDELCKRDFERSYDMNGDLARQGHIHTELLQRLLDDPYFTRAAPKSTGRDYFNIAWLEQHQHGLDLSSHDLLATACELSAITIAQAVKIYAQQRQEHVWICGGGAHNHYLIERIQSHLSAQQVDSCLDKSINPDAIEAMLFAWLAHQRVEQKTIPLSKTTGASRDAILGGIWEP